ncbi:MAG: hypothetical protein HY862_08170 [Chloroflexi bacterium]|nr:hypothetical protein [Chloroflexota bacterium]
MKGYRYQRLAMSLVMALLLLGLVACKKDKTNDGDDVSGVQVAPAIIGTNTPQPPQVVTVVVTRTPIPQITPSLTPTLDFPAYKVAGTWSLYVRFDINDEGLVKQLGYSANATLNVTDYGVVTGNGMLMPTPSDPVCEIHPLGGEGFSFDIQGILRPDGERILMDIELIPTSYSATENYEVRCPEDAPDFRTVSQPNLIWPILSQTQRTKFTFDLTQPSYTVTFTEDIAARTDNVIKGMLAGELITLQ